MKQLEVQIMGQNYLLGCPEGGDEQLLQAVGLVNTAMCKIRDAGKIKARDRIAVLAALNLAFELGERPAPVHAEASLLADPPGQPSGPTDETAHHAAEVPELSALLSRLDAALGIDGRLL